MARSTDISDEKAEVAYNVLRDFVRGWLAEHNRIMDVYKADVAKYDGTDQ